MTPQDKTKPNMTKKHASLTKKYNTKSTHAKTLKPGLVASYNIRPGNGVRLFW